MSIEISPSGLRRLAERPRYSTASNPRICTLSSALFHRCLKGVKSFGLISDATKSPHKRFGAPLPLTRKFRYPAHGPQPCVVLLRIKHLNGEALSSRVPSAIHDDRGCFIFPMRSKKGGFGTVAKQHVSELPDMPCPICRGLVYLCIR